MPDNITEASFRDILKKGRLIARGDRIRLDSDAPAEVPAIYKALEEFPGADDWLSNLAPSVLSSVTAERAGG